NNAQTPYLLPLFLSDTNRDDFILGLAVLSYDIAYLCWTQGVTVNTAAGCNLLENLAICCRAVKLGRDVDSFFMSSEEDAFNMSFKKLYGLHVALQRRRRPYVGGGGMANKKGKPRRESQLPQAVVVQQQGQQQQPQSMGAAAATTVANAVLWGVSGVASVATKHGIGAVKAATTAILGTNSSVGSMISSSLSVGSRDGGGTSSFSQGMEQFQNEFEEEEESGGLLVAGDTLEKVDAGLFALAAVLDGGSSDCAEEEWELGVVEA
ncbi:hypothetical protein HDU99_005742, partial [Rhizoclosmatium hyalinum]